MSHNLLRLSEQVWNVPHLITENALTPILEYFTHRNSPSFAIIPVEEQEPKQPLTAGSIGEILVDGTLTYKPVYAACSPEGCSYVGILEQVEELIDAGVSTIIMTHSSGGGQASHAFSTADTIRSLCTDAGVRLIAYVDTYSASASYLLACIADEVIIHPEASVGSIGCVVALMDSSKAMAQAGLKPIFITSTEGKVPFTPEGSFSKDFLDNIQADVTRLGDKFVEHVSEHTGMSVEAIQGLNARMLHAEEALTAGLVNKIQTHSEFVAYIASLESK